MFANSVAAGCFGRAAQCGVAGFWLLRFAAVSSLVASSCSDTQATASSTTTENSVASPNVSREIQTLANAAPPDTVELPSQAVGLANNEALPGFNDRADRQASGAGQTQSFNLDAGVALDAQVALDATAPMGCPFSGTVEYRLNGADTWPEGVRETLNAAMSEGVALYNCYSDLSHELTVNYNPGVPTAEANVDGWMSFGSNQGYMVVATVMHEIAHTMGVGFFPWTELVEDGRFVGASVVELMASIPPEQRDPDNFSQRDYITADTQHFWPYGLNQAGEHQSEWSLINHVRIVAAIVEDKQRFRTGG